MANMRVQSMLSNAFLKSTKMEISRRSPRWAPSISLRRHNICSSVPRPCRKLFWFFLRSGSTWGLMRSMRMRLYVFAASEVRLMPLKLARSVRSPCFGMGMMPLLVHSRGAVPVSNARFMMLSS